MVTHDRAIPSHWEGDLIKGPIDGSTIGTVVERSSRFAQLTRIEDTDTDAALGGTMRMRPLLKFIKRTLNYDQSKEIVA